MVVRVERIPPLVDGWWCVMVVVPFAKLIDAIHLVFLSTHSYHP